MQLVYVIVEFTCFTKLLLTPIISGFSYLIASMGLQVLWSFGLACLDIYALWVKRDLRNPVLVSLFVVGDWVIPLAFTFTLQLIANFPSIVSLSFNELTTYATRLLRVTLVHLHFLLI